MTQIMERKGVFFDVDDTLYDHLSPFRQAVAAVIGEREGFPYDEAYHRMRYYSDKLSLEMGGAGVMENDSSTELMRRKRFELALAEFGVKLTEKQAADMQAAYIGCQFNITMFDGAKELIKRLVKAGIVVGLLTNGAENHQLRKIRAMELDHLIPPERQFISGKVGWDKPDTRVFRHVNEATGTRPENCVYIGDSWRNDVIGALDAGWSVIWFNHRSANPETDTHTPTHTAASYEELAGLLF
ncbi:HAD family hydrolase [Paenibacillus glycanilyticus]|uniref:Haloacid dehalogenase n=1 Tax=Paenibacillus glycanilyticus TaxID=126569 RepID=A0ABQ6G9I4_9BACL|nr:HAD family hydrolase [Paenibacillus glycanilyticus]GLX67287.1 haloacid dehalogenase [Paenibacillus glycanilyticus]